MSHVTYSNLFNLIMLNQSVKLEKLTVSYIGVLEIDFRDLRSCNLVKKINESFELLPALRLLSFRYIDEDSEDIRHFLTNAVDKVNSLFFNNHVLPKYRIDKIDIGNYMEGKKDFCKLLV